MDGPKRKPWARLAFAAVAASFVVAGLTARSVLVSPTARRHLFEVTARASGLESVDVAGVGRVWVCRRVAPWPWLPFVKMSTGVDPRTGKESITLGISAG